MYELSYIVTENLWRPAYLYGGRTTEADPQNTSSYDEIRVDPL